MERISAFRELVPYTTRPFQENPPVLGVAEPLNGAHSVGVASDESSDFPPQPTQGVSQALVRHFSRGRISLWGGQSPALALAMELC